MSIPSWRELAKQRPFTHLNRRSMAPLVALAVLAWVVEMLDGITGVLMMQHQGSTSELNPFVRGTFQDLGPVAVVLLLKVGPSTLVLLAFLRLARKRPVLARNVLLVALALGSIGVWSNL